ncbi:MAG: FAD-dependent oxidoreductase [Anaerolineae bacterium]|nr:FAD-dependent oxidoreductase [Anaerolineae bacterium]
MVKPVIMTVDDEPQVLNAIYRDLRPYYGERYRIVKAGSGAEALEIVGELKRRNTPIALFLIDQRMPNMEGTQFLAQAATLFPDTRKVLLTAYADTEAAIASINQIGLDYYLMKPWNPPEQNLYPILDDLLGDWWANVELPFDGIRVAGTLWSASSHDTKDFLARNHIPYQWLDIEQDSNALALVESVSGDTHKLPVVFFPDGTVMLQPDHRHLAEKVGLQTQATEDFYDLIIIGAGPAGLGAAVYGASEGLRTLLIDREATGGQAGTSSRIENYLGFPKGLSGADLARRATAQAKRLGAEILTPQEAVALRLDGSYKIVVLGDGAELRCRAVILAMGVSVKRLNVPGADRLSGAGVYYGAALTEASHYRNQPVFVVGGANSAGQGAMFFSRYASNVTMLVRSSSLQKGMSQYLIDQIEDTDNIEVLAGTVVAELHGDERLEAITLQTSKTDEARTLPAAACFIFIGAIPYTEMVGDVVERNRAGFILTGPDLKQDGKYPASWPLKRDPFLLETNVPGVFAAGDVRHMAVRRVASAVGQGANVVSMVHQYLKTV